jgi:hypothetical protein
MPMENILISQPHIDSEVDIVRLVKDAFAIVDRNVE